MSQCVPSWDLDENPTQPKLSFCSRSNLTNSFSTDVPSLDYGVSELAWENGQLAMYGLGPPRLPNKSVAAAMAAWEKPHAADTLESIVDQATANPHSKPVGGNKLVPWLDHRHALVNPAATTSNVDALVPCNNMSSVRSQENSTHVPGIGTCMVGSCSGGGRLARAGPGCGKSYASAGESATCGGGESLQVTLDSCDREFGGGITSTSLWSPENTSSGEDYTKTSTDDHDSGFQSRSQRQTGEKGNKKRIGKSAVSAKSRAAAVHNQSERRRRDKINQRMKTLQKLVPNSSKTDKASMLDEVIEYLKQLQAQVHMMGRMNMPSMSMMMPLPMQQQLQMSIMAPTMGMGMGMGMGVMDINAMGRVAGMPPMMPPPAAAPPPFMPMPSWDIHCGDRLQFPQLTPDFLSTFLACQAQQPMTMDAYSRMTALYQQSLAGSGSKN